MSEELLSSADRRAVDRLPVPPRTPAATTRSTESRPMPAPRARRAPQRRPTGERGRQGVAQLAQGVEAAEAGAEVVRVELLDPRREPEARQVREERVVRRPGTEKEAPPELPSPRPRRQIGVKPIEQPRADDRLRLPQAELRSEERR